MIGFIDTGIDYTNPAFRYSDGSSRIVRIWDQTIQDGTPPVGILYGADYTREQINAALLSENPYDLVPSRDMNGHGTFLAGVACGSESENGDFIGAAPQSRPHAFFFHRYNSDKMAEIPRLHDFLHCFQVPHR